MIKLIVANLIFMYFMFLICQEVEGSELMVHGGFSPCDNDSDCEHFPHGQCVDSFCECNGTRFCSDESQTKVTKLGERCHVGADCNIEHSVCEKGECRCESGRVGSEDGRSCLKHGPCIGPLCYGTPSDKSPAPCIVGRCECAEEKQFCTNQAESHLNTKGSPFLADDDEDDYDYEDIIQTNFTGKPGPSSFSLTFSKVFVLVFLTSIIATVLFYIAIDPLRRQFFFGVVVPLTIVAGSVGNITWIQIKIKLALLNSLWISAMGIQLIVLCVLAFFALSSAFFRARVGRA